MTHAFGGEPGDERCAYCDARPFSTATCNRLVGDRVSWPGTTMGASPGLGLMFRRMETIETGDLVGPLTINGKSAADGWVTQGNARKVADILGLELREVD